MLIASVPLSVPAYRLIKIKSVGVSVQACLKRQASNLKIKIKIKIKLKIKLKTNMYG
jgi:hypothetical protein